MGAGPFHPNDFEALSTFQVIVIPFDGYNAMPALVRLASCALQGGEGIYWQVLCMQVAQAIDFVIHVERREGRRDVSSAVRVLDARLHGTHLERTTLRESVAHGARFTDARMGRADLSNADLRAADLSGADAREATFDGARMYGVRAIVADCSEALFQDRGGQRVDLRKADLRSVALEKASMRGANLGETELTTNWWTGRGAVGTAALQLAAP